MKKKTDTFAVIKDAGDVEKSVEFFNAAQSGGEGMSMFESSKKNLTDNNREELNKAENVILYELPSGRCPVIELLDSIQQPELRVETISNILLLSEQGRAATSPLVAYIRDGIYELRTSKNSNISRVFYFFIFGNKIVLTNGYVKKTRKMDPGAFELAKRYRDDFSKTSTRKEVKK